MFEVMFTGLSRRAGDRTARIQRKIGSEGLNLALVQALDLWDEAVLPRSFSQYPIDSLSREICYRVALDVSPKYVAEFMVTDRPRLVPAVHRLSGGNQLKMAKPAMREMIYCDYLVVKSLRCPTYFEVTTILDFQVTSYSRIILPFEQDQKVVMFWVLVVVCPGHHQHLLGLIDPLRLTV